MSYLGGYRLNRDLQYNATQFVLGFQTQRRTFGTEAIAI